MVADLIKEKILVGHAIKNDFDVRRANIFVLTAISSSR
jgi:hypothetical protein